MDGTPINTITQDTSLTDDDKILFADDDSTEARLVPASDLATYIDDKLTPPALTGGKINIRKYTTSGTHTWTRPANLLYLKAYIIGAGGSGASIPAITDGHSGRHYSGAGMAGQGGATRIRFFNASDLGVSETVTVGAGGASIASPPAHSYSSDNAYLTYSDGQVGNDGGDSSYASVTAKGGKGARNITTHIYGNGFIVQAHSGAPATPTLHTKDIAYYPNDINTLFKVWPHGSSNINRLIWSSKGGKAFGSPGDLEDWRQFNEDAQHTNNGGSGRSRGDGGGSAIIHQTPSNSNDDAVGGAGAKGEVILVEYIGQEVA